jgi:uncharacterized protein (TIGR02391 family)
MARRPTTEEPIERREFRSEEEIARAIAKLQSRIKDLEELDISNAIRNETGADDVVMSDVRNTIGEVFGPKSPEYREHRHIQLWAGTMYMNMPDDQILEARLKGRTLVINVLKGLIKRLEEVRGDIFEGAIPAPTAYFDKLNLHPRIADVARDLFLDGHHWEAVFAAGKALVNYVKDRSGLELDGAKLMYAAFSRDNPVLAVNALSNQTDRDVQEGTMHLFVGATLAIRNPGGHSFPEGSEQRAIESISLLSMLAFLVQESKKHKTS